MNKRFVQLLGLSTLLICPSTWAYDFSNPRPQSQKSLGGSYATDRSGQVLLDNGGPDMANKPYIKRVAIASETSDEIVFDVTYYMIDFNKDDYRISIQPNHGHWGYSDTEFYPGTHTTQIRLFFRPRSDDVHHVTSDKLDIYIGEHENCVTYKGKVFDRSVSFVKTWSYD